MSTQLLEQASLSTDEAEKKKILNKKELDEVDRAFSLNALRVLASRYLLRNSSTGEITESPKQLFERVATLVGLADVIYDERYFDKDGNQARLQFSVEDINEIISAYEGPAITVGKYVLNKYHIEALGRIYVRLANQGKMKLSFSTLLRDLATDRMINYEKVIKAYYDLMASRDFLPNTPTLMNAGARLGQLSACFVLDMPDDMLGIMKASTDVAMIFKSGGGVGINYSDLRPEGDVVGSTHGVASGPLSFMGIVDKITDVIKQGGKRRGANMGIMEAWHPDILKFINAKKTPGVLENFNVSVALDEEFWHALDNDQVYWQKNPKDGSARDGINPHQLLDVISNSAWESAEPGVIFLDNVNKRNILETARGKKLRATNPCGEQSIYPNESCNLGSINLANFVDGEFFDFKRFETVVRLSTRFLDGVVDMNKYPLVENEIASMETRRIGVGSMGLADLLFKLKIRYTSQRGHKLMDEIAEVMSYRSMEESVRLSKERGPFGLFNKTTYIHGELPIEGAYDSQRHVFDWDEMRVEIQENGIRNCLTTTVAPTGTLSMLADCSNGIEPVFALAFEKHVSVGKFFYTNDILTQALKAAGIYSEELAKKIAENHGSLQDLHDIPQHIRDTFITTMDMQATDHIHAQAIWQRWIGNAISKTINLPHDAKPEDVREAYVLAHKLGLKGVTVYRDGSRKEQVLHFTK